MKISSQNKYKQLFEGKFTKTFMYEMSPIEKFYYNFSSSTYNEKILFDVVKKTIGNKKNFRILDVGCGGGHYNLTKFGEVYGVDVSSSSLKNAKKIYKLVKEADAAKEIPFKNNYFDLIFISEVFGHIEVKDKNNFLNEVFRVTKPGGYVVLSIETIGNNIFTKFLKNKKLFDKYWIDYQGHIGLETPLKTLVRLKNKFSLAYVKKTSSHLLPIDGYLILSTEYSLINILRPNLLRRIVNVIEYPFYILSLKLSSLDTANDIVVLARKNFVNFSDEQFSRLGKLRYNYEYFRNLYNANYLHSTWESQDKHRNERLKRIAKFISPNNRVLDYGGGNGDLGNYLRKNEYRILDISKEHSISDLKRVHLSNDIYIMDESESYDVVVMSEILEHLPNVYETLMEVRRVLKKNGKLIVSVPNPFSIVYILKSILGKHQDPSNEHLYWYDWSYLSNLLLSVGFALEYKSTFNLIPSRLYEKIYLFDKYLSRILPNNGSQLLCVFIKN